MSIWISTFKYLRRQLIFGLLFVFLFTYCILNLLGHEKKEQIFGNDFDDMDNMNIGNNNDIFNNEDGDEQIARTSDKSLLWHMEVMNDVGNENSIEFINNDNFNNNEMFSKPCRNSVQDKFLIVDENGYLCTRYELSNGCCNKNILEQTTIISNLVSLRKNRYTCKTCNPQGCCTIYEYCVSCCLHPKKIKKIEYLNKYQIQRKNFKLRHGEDILKLRLRSLDRFQLCLAACRTSSASVHENTYNNPFYKYCYILQLSRNHFKQTKET